MTFVSVKNNNMSWNKTEQQGDPLPKFNKYTASTTTTTTNAPSFWEEITLGEVIYIVVCLIFIMFYCMFLFVLIWKMFASWRKCWREIKQQANMQSKRTSVHIQLEYGYNNNDGGETILVPIPTRSVRTSHTTTTLVNEKDLDSSVSDLTCRESLYSLNVVD